jgi:hypothetical protein
MGDVGEGIERLDAQLATLTREEASLRLRVGQTLEVLARGGVFQLGFSSLSAYALERCDRSVRWAEAARCLARRVEVLPELRRAMAAGRVSWSMAELVARVARPEDENRWLEAAESRTVRQMRVLVAEAVALRAASSDGGKWNGTQAREEQAREEQAREEDGVPGGDEPAGDEDGETPGSEVCSLTCTVDQEDAWLFEATRLLLEHLGVTGADARGEALLAEGQGTLLARLPDGVLDLAQLEGNDVAQQSWVRELARWRVEAEALCEDRFCGLLWPSRAQRFFLDPVGGSPTRAKEPAAEPGDRVAFPPAEARGAVAVAAARGMAALEELGWAELDGHVRELSRMLAQHELDVSRLVLELHRAGGWRRLGYATETQYARERLGWSISALRGRRSLGLRLERLPRVAEALGAGQLGVEAALQVVRVATGPTEAAWVERARRRTVKHLREEVGAALVARRFSGEVDCAPPLAEEMAGFQRLEQAVVSGRVCRGEAAGVANDNGAGGEKTSAKAMRLAEPTCWERRAWFVMLSSLAQWLEGGLQLSAGNAAGRPAGAVRRGESMGRVTLRLRMSRSTCSWWRGLEAQARRWLPQGMSWLRFLCLSMWQTWRHRVGAEVAYSKIYERDCYRCRSPVCSRRDVTPHHIRFRSAGGSDDAENIGGVCTWCHLEGVHGGRIRATGTASLIHWEIGAGSPCVIVHGRERVVA